MPFSSDEGFTPQTVNAILEDIMAEINDQFGTEYTWESFQGTNHYKYYYALAQKIQENQVKASEVFTKLQQYFIITNEAISRPVTTPPGLLEALEEADYVASIKPPDVSEAGEIRICVDVEDNHAQGSITITSYANLVSGTDDVVTIGATAFTAQSGAATPGAATFQAATSNDATATSLATQINAHATAGALVLAEASGAVVSIRAIAEGTGGNAIALGYTDNDTNVGATKSGTALTGGATADEDYDDVRLEICTLIKDKVVAGVVSVGTETETIVLTNGQAFDFSFNLPNRIEIWLRLTITLSENNQFVVGTPDDTKNTLMENIAERYSLGKNFEPQKYFDIDDAPWASEVLLEWTDDVTDGELDGSPVWNTTVYDAEYDDLFDYALERLTLVEA